jgi:hypothetical protein
MITLLNEFFLLGILINGKYVINYLLLLKGWDSDNVGELDEGKEQLVVWKDRHDDK